MLSSDRPRERLQSLGPSHLEDAELLSLVLGTRSPTVARDVLERFPDLRRLASAGLGELSQISGVGMAQACRLKAALALASRLDERPVVRGERLAFPEDVYARYRPRLAHLEHEVFMAVALDGRHRVLCELHLAAGGSSHVDIVPRDVFTVLVREAAKAVIFIHNHPSGDPRPSAEDRAMTARMREAGNLVGVPVLDHVIVAEDGFTSFARDWG